MIKQFIIVAALLVASTQSAKAEPWWQSLGMPDLPSFDVDVSGIPLPNAAGIAADVSGGATEGQYHAGQETGGFDLFQLMERTILAMPDCLDYCITGIDNRYKFPATYIFAALIRHNNADLLMEIYPSLSTIDAPVPQIISWAVDEESVVSPWNEWADIMSKGQYKLTKNWARAMYSFLGFDGGVHSVANYGSEQSHGFKEAHAIGHPYVLIPYLLDSATGEISEACQSPPEGSTPEGEEPATGPRSDACIAQLPGGYQQAANAAIEDEEPDPVTGEEPEWYELTPEELADAAVSHFEDEANNYIADVQACAVDLRCLLVDVLDSPDFQRIFNIVDSIEDSIETIKEAAETIQTIADVAALIAGGGIGVEVRVDRLLCPSGDVTALMPYYLSGVDPQWRSGLIDVPPFSFPNDPHMIGTIINPLSADRVGQNNELWGHIFPRSGVYDHVHDAKAGMLITKRLENILIEPQRRRLRWNAAGFGPSEEGWHGKWQMIYPFVKDECEIEPWTLADLPPNVHGDFMYPGKEQRYAFNYWREKACGTTTKGSSLFEIDIPEICF